MAPYPKTASVAFSKAMISSTSGFLQGAQVEKVNIGSSVFEHIPVDGKGVAFAALAKFDVKAEKIRPGNTLPA